MPGCAAKPNALSALHGEIKYIYCRANSFHSAVQPGGLLEDCDDIDVDDDASGLTACATAQFLSCAHNRAISLTDC